MDPTLVTFGNLFKNAGYATGIAGRWQLGRDSGLPEKVGFDESCLWQHTRRPPRYANPGLEINGVEKDCTNGEYGPDRVNAYALDFITRHQATPFFLYYPMILTHAPHQPTLDSKTWDPKAQGGDVHKRPEHFGDMVEYMDKLTEDMLRFGTPGFKHHFGLWHDRRRDRHDTARRQDDRAQPPFLEQPWARGDTGRAWDGLPLYELTRFNAWYFERLKQFAGLCDRKGTVLLFNCHMQHALDY